MAKSITDIRTQATDLTPYEVFRILKDAVTQVDAERAAQLVPQTTYNHDRNGFIVKGRASKNHPGAGRYTIQEADAYATKWISKHYPNYQPPTTTESPVDLISKFRAQINR